MDVDRLAQLVDAHSAALELYAARWTAAPEDAVQEAFVELAGQAVEPAHARAWLFRVVKNRALNSARGERRRREREQAAVRLRPQNDGPSSPLALDVTQASNALCQLESELHEAIVLRIWSGLSFEEMALVAGCSLATAHRRYCRALKELRKILEPTSCPTTSHTNCPQS